MRTRSVSICLALTVLAGSGLTGCGSSPSDGIADPPAGNSQASASSGGGAAGAGGQGGEGTSTEAASPEVSEDLDIHTVDLANTTWLYSEGGFGVPYEVQLVDGAAVIDENGFPAQYELGEVVYGDIDADGHDDAVARISRSQDNGFKALWYAWLARGAEAEQLKYPIAETGRCGTFVEAVVVGEGAVKVTEYLRVQGLDDRVPCSDPGTGLRQRSVTVHAEGSDAWPVQTAPVAAWGGLCPGARYPDTSPGLVDMWTAPSKGSTPATSASPDGGALFEQKDAPLMEKDGWELLGFRLFGGGSDLPEVDMACAWAMP